MDDQYDGPRVGIPPGIVLHPGQQAYCQSMVPRTAFCGGFGSGKSFVACIKGLLLSAYHAGCPGMIVSPTYPMLKDILLPTMFDEIIEPLGLGDCVKWVASETRLVFPWKSNIVFRSADKPLRLRGHNLAWAEVDEASIVEKFTELWTALVSRLRHPKTRTVNGVPQYFLGLTYTPEGENDGVHDKFERPPEDPVAYRYWRKTFLVIRGKTSDNPAATAEYIEQLTQDTPEELRPAYLDGEYVDVKRGRCYWAMKDSLIKAQAYDPGQPLRFSFDFNISPMTCLVWQCSETPPGTRSKIRILTEVALLGSNTREVCTLIMEMYSATKVPIFIYGDATGGGGTAEWSDFDTIRETFRGHFPNMNLHVGESNPTHRTRLYSVNKKMRDDEIEIDPSAKRLIRDLRYQRMEDNGISKTKKQIMDGESLGHCSDCLDYLTIWHWEYRLPNLRQERKKKMGALLGHGR